MKSLLYWIIGFFVLLGLYALINYKGDKKIEPVVSTQVQYVKILSAAQQGESGPVVVTFEGGATTTIPRDIELGQAQDVSIVDINYDNKDDVMVVDTAGAYNLSTTFYTFNEATKKFVEYDGFKKASGAEDEYFDLGAVNLDLENRKITSFFKGRGLGDMYSLVEYSFVNNAWYESKSEVQDVLNYDLYESSKWYYYRTIVEYKPSHATTSEKTTYYVQKADGDIGELVEVPRAELVKRKLIK
jgi:hypothetical protein